MNKTAVIIHGSPRRGGNTDTVLSYVARGMKEQVPETRIEDIYPSQMNIHPCKECRACDSTGQCIIDDEMQSLYPLLTDADVLILSSPVFFYGMSGWVKALIDRCQALWAKKYLCRKPLSSKPEESKSGWFVAVGATKGKRLFGGVQLTARYFFDAVDIPFSDSLLIRGLDKREDAGRRPDILDLAFSFGTRIGHAAKQHS